MTDSTKSKHKLTLAWLAKPSRAKRLAMTLCMMLTLPALAGCGTTAGIVTASVGNKQAEQRARCAGWRGIEYAVEGDPAKGETHGDTSNTIAQIRVHNQTGVNKHCWAK